MPRKWSPPLSKRSIAYSCSVSSPPLLYLVLAIVGGWGGSAWWGVVAIALLVAYTAFGGLRSVAITDALQSLVMVVSSVALFLADWAALGGWGGMEAKLDAHEQGLAAGILHGTFKLLAPFVATPFGVAILPPLLVSNYASTVVSLLLTVGVTVALTVVRGRESTGEPRVSGEAGWLGQSRVATRADRPAPRSVAWLPAALGTATFRIGAFRIGAILSFAVFW